MMKLIKIETALLAKEKGFPQDLNVGVTCRIQNKVNKDFETTTIIRQSHLDNEWSIFNEVYPTKISLQNWLIEDCNIVVVPTFSEFNRTYGYKIYHVVNGTTVCINQMFMKFNSMGDAIEAGLFEALKLIP